MKTLYFLTSAMPLLMIIILVTVVILLCIFFFRCGVSRGAREHAGTYITPAVAATHFKKKPLIVTYLGEQNGHHMYGIQMSHIMNYQIYICDTLFELVENRYYTFDDVGSLILWGSTNNGDFFDY